MNRYVITITIDTDAKYEDVRDAASKVGEVVDEKLKKNGAKLGFRSVETRDKGEAPELSKDYGW